MLGGAGGVIRGRGLGSMGWRSRCSLQGSGRLGLIRVYRVDF